RGGRGVRGGAVGSRRGRAGAVSAAKRSRRGGGRPIAAIGPRDGGGGRRNGGNWGCACCAHDLKCTAPFTSMSSALDTKCQCSLT
ncbi:hypothetical protein HMPREF9005_0667, partial [Actinomyces sp. oral taxon 178 str. F0338]